MNVNTPDLIPPAGEPVLRDCMRTLRRISEYRLPLALDQRLLWLSENKESLNETQRDELAALLELADRRSLDKVQAQATLTALAKFYPALANGNS